MKAEIIYQDILNCRVCSDGTWDQTLEWVREHFPAGTEHNWQKKTELDAAAPVQCANDQTRTHYMFIC